MESGIRARMVKSNAPSSVASDIAYAAGTIHPSPKGHGQTRSNSLSPGKSDTPYKSTGLLSLLRFDYPGEENCARVSRDNLEIKIMIFSIKFDKFTGFFDKFLKNTSLINGCNQKSYYINLSVSHSDSAAKKVFRLPRISPQQPAFARLGVAGFGFSSGRVTARTSLHEGAQQVERQGEDDGGVVLGGDFRERLQEAELERARGRGDGGGGF